MGAEELVQTNSPGTASSEPERLFDEHARKKNFVGCQVSRKYKRRDRLTESRKTNKERYKGGESHVGRKGRNCWLSNLLANDRSSVTS
jgi:hypothetical protein